MRPTDGHEETARFDALVEPLLSVLTEYVSGTVADAAFLRHFRAVLATYEAAVGDRAYYPLRDIATWTEGSALSLRDLCSHAAKRLPLEALDRATRVWIERTLLSGDEFSFTNQRGDSLFGDVLDVYSTDIEEDGFLLSAISGSVTPQRPPYRQMLAALRTVAANELATWFYGTEPDGALAVIHWVWSLGGDAYSETNHLREIERHPGEEGGMSYLVLVPKSRSWLLSHEFDHARFSIRFHGSEEAVRALQRELQRRDGR